MIRCSRGSKCKFVQLYVPTRETSPAAKNEEKRLFSQARTIDVFLISPSVNRCRFVTESVDPENRKLAKDARQNESRKPLVAATFKPNGAQILRAKNLYGTKFWSQKISLPIARAPSSPISSFPFLSFVFLCSLFFSPSLHYLNAWNSLHPNNKLEVNRILIKDKIHIAGQNSIFDVLK